MFTLFQPHQMSPNSVHVRTFNLNISYSNTITTDYSATIILLIAYTAWTKISSVSNARKSDCKDEGLCSKMIFIATVVSFSFMVEAKNIEIGVAYYHYYEYGDMLVIHY